MNPTTTRRAAFLKWLRVSHAWLGLWGAVLGLLFGVSGVLLNHRNVMKLPAGHMILYPSTSLHSVRPVTRGARVASFFWIQSMVRDDGQRTLLFDLDSAIQQVGAAIDHPAVVQLTGVYHNLIRRWADA